jgi:hypothetical protein
MVWKKGESGCSEGRGKGNRDKLSRAFMRALVVDFDENGVAAITKVRNTDPASYLRVIASVLPKELEVTNVDKDLSDEQLADIIAALRSGISAGIIREAAKAEGEREQAQDIPALH